jgi:signal transduction histidine kinase
LYNEERQEIEYRLAIENGQRYEPYVRDATNENQFPVWCLRNKSAVFINDVENEYSKYVREWDDKPARLLDGSYAAVPRSLIYLPLIAGDRVLGVITTQSFEKNAYTDYDLNILSTLAAYTSIALDNADAYRRLGATLDKVKSMQAQLVTQEKLASLGQLTAGIAHELNNPLNFVNNFAEVNTELISDLRASISNYPEVLAEVDSILGDVARNGTLIEEHGRRAKGIVASMMQHASDGSASATVTDINMLVGEHIDLVYHGKVAQIDGVNINLTRDFQEGVGSSLVVASDIGRVLLNLLGNAVDAVVERAALEDGMYRPSVRVTTRKKPGRIEIGIEDNGMGIPADFQEKIFEPFFTTKPTGTGTGLGLSLSHDIITQAHGGTLSVESEPGKGARFVVTLNAVVVKRGVS